MKVTEQQNTFLELKWGKGYKNKLLNAWFDDDQQKFSTLEKAIVLDWHMKLAGVAPKEKE